VLTIVLADFVLRVIAIVYSKSQQRGVALELQPLSRLAAIKSALGVAVVVWSHHKK
jgi:hypothetical protein